MNTHYEKRSEADDKEMSSVHQETTQWIMCNNDPTIENSKIGYNCESRPYMTVLLIVTILIFIILRKSTFIKNWVTSHQEKIQQEQTDEEEGLMQRVF